MPEPNPLWGVHAAPGAITGALVQRTDDGGFRVLTTLVEDAPHDEAGMLAAVSHFLQRRDVTGRAAHIALPDEDGTFLRVELTPEEQYLDDRELTAELFERTMFEPSQGQLMFRRLAAGSGRDLLVSAMPREPVRRREAGLPALDPAFHGLGLTGPAVLRGAQALGLTGERALLTDVQPDQTVVTAVGKDSVRRYVLPAGSSALGTQADALAKDLIRLARYHVEQESGRDNGREVADEDLPPIVLVGPGARTSKPLLTRLPTSMTAHGVGPTRIRGKDGTPLDRDDAHATAIAIGAALEALGAPADRLAIRAPPTDVPAYVPPPGAKRGLLWLATAAAVALAVIVWQVLPSGGEDAGTGDPATETAEVATGAGADQDAAGRTALREALDTAARRRAFAEAVALATRIVEATGERRPEYLMIAHSAGAEASAYELELQWGVLTGGQRESLQTALESLPVESARLRVSGHFGVFGTVAIRPAPDSALHGPASEPSPAGASTVGSVLDRRGATRTNDRLNVDVAAHEVTPLLRDVLGCATPPSSLQVSVKPDGAFVVAATEGSEGPTGTQVTAAARAVLEEVTRVADRAADGLPTTLLSAAAAPPASAPTLLSATDGTVRLRLPVGEGDLLLERAGPGDSRFSTVAEAAAGSEVVDYVPGRSGTYRWRVLLRGGRPGPELEAEVAIPVLVEFVEAYPEAGTARLRLSRPWKGGRVAAEVDVGAGSVVRTKVARDGLEIALETDYTIARIETMSRAEDAPVTVPEFGPDGTVLRGPSGEPTTRSGVRTRERSVPVVRAVDRVGAPVVWNAFEK